ncbi:MULTISPECIES: hypothetical protein [Erysipelotrichaceae]|uniref:hypothetical protein n=1 Tax=Erysipelotrichaceae TaxID=128827 RepID=UPI000E496BE4|nr:hypothetical protein [Absiella sp. AM27-20]RHT97982.1 hypothetical protein DW716_23305 [Absiella sp. AM27-20]
MNKYKKRSLRYTAISFISFLLSIATIAIDMQGDGVLSGQGALTFVIILGVAVTYCNRALDSLREYIAILEAAIIKYEKEILGEI